MKFGDHCWLKGLQGRPELNGQRVMLHKWLDAQQRWNCLPKGWECAEDFVSVRPRNLSNEPVPRWALRNSAGAKATDNTTLSPDNSEVYCINQREFVELDVELPPAPTWDAVCQDLRGQMAKALAAGVPAGDQSERAKCAAELEVLMRREAELRKGAVGDSTATDALRAVSVEDTLRHMLCQEALLKAQVYLFVLRGENELVQQGSARLRELYNHLNPLKATWSEKGKPKIDFWEDSKDGEADSDGEGA